LTVKQTQKVEGRVGTFRVPVDLEITTSSGPKLYDITVSKAEQVFTFPSDSAPLMVLFDKGGHILKSVEFHKEKKEWQYQLKNAAEFADRADAALALAKIKGEDDVVAALGAALTTDKSSDLRTVAADALGRVGNAAAAKQLLAALDSNKEPFVRAHIAAALGSTKDDPQVAPKLASIAREDASWRARANALQSLGHLKTPEALNTLTAAVSSESPDRIVRNSALRGLGYLGDDKGVPVLREWSAPGKPIDSRNTAIASLARLQKDNKDLTE